MTLYDRREELKILIDNLLLYTPTGYSIDSDSSITRSLTYTNTILLKSSSVYYIQYTSNSFGVFSHNPMHPSSPDSLYIFSLDNGRIVINNESEANAVIHILTRIHSKIQRMVIFGNGVDLQ